jgi:hypothetical protein
VVRAHPTVPEISITYRDEALSHSVRGNSWGSNSIEKGCCRSSCLANEIPLSFMINCNSEHQTTNLGVRSSNLFGRASIYLQ